jgi:putative membrane protein
MLAALLSALHLFALGIGLPAVYLRGRALRRRDVPAVLAADNAWGVAALLWWSTGPLRAFAGFEKGTDWYLAQPAFHLKLGLFALAGLLELWPMVTFLRWRVGLRKGRAPDLSRVGALLAINRVELVIVVAIVFVASAMARGIGG